MNQFERFSLRSDGVEVLVSIRVNRIQYAGEQCLVVLARDISERVKAEEANVRHQAQLAHFSRLRIMGELVAGIAHEVSQPLYAITNFASVCQSMVKKRNDVDLDQLNQWTDKISVQAKRAGDIIRKMREFAKNRGPQRSPHQLEVLIRDCVDFVSVEARESRVDVHVDLAEPEAIVLIDMVQIQQVLINLLRNAFQSMVEADIERRFVIVRPIREDDMIDILVADNGPGLSIDRDTSVFDAFVTTKSDGLGLGLAISRSIIESHGGRLWVDESTEPVPKQESSDDLMQLYANPKGARFHFTIPVQLDTPKVD